MRAEQADSIRRKDALAGCREPVMATQAECRPRLRGLPNVSSRAAVPHACGVRGTQGGRARKERESMASHGNSVKIGAVELATPVVLSPMAGVTNPPFRQLCREQAEAGIAVARAQRSSSAESAGEASGTGLGTRLTGTASASGVEAATGMGEATGAAASSDAEHRGIFAPAGLWVCEMATTRALVEGREKTLNMVQPDPGDPVRSVQLYGVSPKVTAQAVRILVRNGWADHVDLNFGCPAPKVTRRGGGSALPWKTDLFSQLCEAAVQAAREASEEAGREEPVPVTAKIRLGIDAEHETWRDSVRLAEDAGISALTLHARTTSQYYAGHADWNAIGELVQLADLPVFGNGDVFDVADAKELMELTGCAGVAIGRGAQGRPWIFANLAAWMHGGDVHVTPNLGEVAAIIRRHAQLAAAHYGDELKAMREMRGHIASYLRGFAIGGQVRDGLARISTFEDLESGLALLDPDMPYPQAADGRRGRAGKPKRPRLPEGWLDSRTLSEAERERISHAEIGVSGG